MNELIGKDFEDFKIDRFINEGAFGCLFIGLHKRTKNPVAIKFEPKQENGQLKNEYDIYRKLGKKSGLPEIFYYGQIGKWTGVAMELLGPSLQYLFEKCNHKFSCKTTVLILLQILQIIQYIHEKGIVHQDIKPQNFMLGRKNTKNSKVLYIIDFGLSKYYIKHGRHIEFRTDKSMVGTIRYMSINVHMKYESSRRDDLESIAYMIINFLRGSLPWKGIQIKDDNTRFERIALIKQATMSEDLCQGFPIEFAKFLDYTRQLEFEQTPKYYLLKKMFVNLFERENYIDDEIYDWDVIDMTEESQLTFKDKDKDN